MLKSMDMERKNKLFLFLCLWGNRLINETIEKNFNIKLHGYITIYFGSHTCVEPLNAGYEIIVVDNFSNSKPGALKRIQEITNKSLSFVS
jgi:hypothetical protein